MLRGRANSTSAPPPKCAPTGRNSSPSCPAYLIGRATHGCIFDERKAYESRFALGGPIDPSTGKPYGATTKKFAQWQALQGKPALSHERLEPAPAAGR